MALYAARAPSLPVGSISSTYRHVYFIQHPVTVALG